jgi:hypothetical protein
MESGARDAKVAGEFIAIINALILGEALFLRG